MNVYVKTGCMFVLYLVPFVTNSKLIRAVKTLIF